MSINVDKKFCPQNHACPSTVKLLLKNDFKNVYHMNRGLVEWNYELK